MSWPFDHLTPMKYGALLVDFPWEYIMRSDKGYEKSPESHYETMSLEELMELPIGHLAAGDCLGVFWSTWPHLEMCLKLIQHHGFTYKTGGAWHKKTVNGKSAFGTGYILRSATEPYIIATIGKPKIRSKSVRNVIETIENVDGDDVEIFPSAIEFLRREHSRKPPQMRENIEQLMPHVYAAELFAREPWAGNDVWGKEVNKFSEAV